MKSWLIGNEDGQDTAIPAAPTEQVRTDLSDVEVEGQQSTAAPIDAPVAPDAADPARPADQPEMSTDAGAAAEDTRVAVEDGEADTAVESQLVEVQGVDAELDQLLADGETLEQDTRMVEAVADEVAATASEGGMTESAARIAEVAVESYCSRWGISRIKVASESFGSRSNRMKATAIAMEGIGETIASGWDKFVKFVKALVERFTKAFKHYTGLGLSIKEKAEKLKAKVGASKVGAAKSDKIKGGFLSQLVIAGKLDPKAVISCAHKLGGEVNTVANQLSTYVGAIIDNKTTKLPTIKLGQTAKAPGAAAGAAAYALPGSIYLIVTENELKIVKHDGGAKAEELPVPSVADIQAALDGAIAAGAALDKGAIAGLEKLNAAIETVSNSKKFSGDALRAAVKSGKNEEVANAREAVNRAQPAVRSAAAFQDAATKGLRAAAVGLYSYAQAALAAYGKGKENAVAAA